MLNYLIVDIENNNSDKYKRDAGNFMFDEIVAIGMNDGNAVISRYVYPDKLKSLDLDDIDVLVGHNIKHDLLFLWELADLQNFFKRGGKVFDTQYAEYCLTGQQSKYASLRDIAVNKYGCPVREKHIDTLLFDNPEAIKAGMQVSDLPKDLVLKDVENDVRDTEQVYLQQLKKAEELGMTKLLEMEMDSILATTEMEYNGLHVNKEILLKNKAALDILLGDAYNELDKLVRKYTR